MKYKKSGEEDTSSFNCLNNCVYEKVDSPGSKYCFKEGDLTVECGKGGKFDHCFLVPENKVGKQSWLNLG